MMYRRKVLLGLVLLFILVFLIGIFYFSSQEKEKEYGRKTTLVWAEEQDYEAGSK